MNIETRGLRGKRVGILAGDGFEYVELAIPKMALASYPIILILYFVADHARPAAIGRI